MVEIFNNGAAMLVVVGVPCVLLLLGMLIMIGEGGDDV